MPPKRRPKNKRTLDENPAMATDSRSSKAESGRISLVAIILLSLPILIYGFRILATGDLLGLQDWDWFFSHYDAIRRSIIEHGQFPWWNPWSAGGTPLFADPQIGLVSIQTPLVLMFGTVMGLKIGVVIYLLAGFRGMHLLLRLMTDDHWRITLLSYLFISSTFVTFHYTAGHYTFLLYLLVPWVVWSYLHQLGTTAWLVRFTLITGFFVNTAPHYIALQTVIWMLGVFVVMAVRNRDQLHKFAAMHLFALFLILPMIIPKAVFALEYLGDFPREPLHNPSIGLAKGIEALTFPVQAYSHPDESSKLGSWEFSAYVGIATIGLFVGLLVYQIWQIKRGSEKREPLMLAFATLAGIAFVVGLGPFASMSPWSIMTSLPVLESMQVPSRWFGWTIFFVLLAIGSVKNAPRWTLVLLAISLVELTTMNLLREQPFVLPLERNADQSAKIFEQFDVYPRTKDLPYETTFMAMQQNYGEVRAYEPLLGNNQLQRPTARRGINDGYRLLTDNAELIEWSPNRIQFKRIGPGDIYLNANIGRWWTFNGEYLFLETRVTEPTMKFPIPEEAPQVITLECQPLRVWLLYLPLLTLAGYGLLYLLRQNINSGQSTGKKP